MQLITHKSHLSQLPHDKLAEFIIKRFEQIVEDSNGETIPTIILVKPTDDVVGSNFAFVGNRGLLSDAYEQAELGDAAFVRPYEWVSYHPELKLYELLLLLNGEDGYWILIPEAIAENHPDLKWVLTAESLGGLSEPQPLY